MRQHHVPLFHARLVRERAKAVDAAHLQKHRESISVWLDHLRKGTLDVTKEVSLHGGFLERIFGDVLGYPSMAQATQGRWELTAEKSVLSGGSADGAIGFFEKGAARVVAPIELKGAGQFLDHAKGRSRTPIQQGWDYANNVPESRWVIVSNYRETRLYAKSRGQGAYELFQLEELATEDGLRRFIAILGRDAILGGPSPDASPLAEMLLASERAEREVTEKLYAEYRGIRAKLFEELRRKHPNIPATDLLGHAQTILDRVLFVAFAEDRQLLPPNTLARAYEHRNAYNPEPIWQNFLGVFRSIDKGNSGLGIAAYNGGLFAQNEEISDLELSDEMCRSFTKFGEYDFADDVSVDVLGHVFEQSVTDLEQLRLEAAANPNSQHPPPMEAGGTQKKPSKRKREGIFYTPAFVTSYLVRETLGQVLGEAWEEAGAARAPNKEARIAAWEAYREKLRRIRILDPACGSGAFLIAAFDTLAQEFDRTDRTLRELRGDRHVGGLFDLRNVLNENLFGVDKSGESVEISKLSLWLKTAQKNKQLTFLDRNIRQGNSVVSDRKVDPIAFDWSTTSTVLQLGLLENTATDAIDARWREGFDVVIGNPPYVRQELLTAYKDHWKKSYDSFDGTADLFVYFFERGLQQLKPGGRLGFIVSNKWLKGGYAEKLREIFRTRCTIETLVDFGHAPIFPDADAFPCIITLRKSKAPPEHAVSVTLYPREELGKELLASYIETHRFAVPQAKLDRAGWSLDPPEVRALLDKLRQNGVPLAEHTQVKPYRGVLTGLNEAFLIDQATKERLCREDPRSTQVMRKYLRGQDIARWTPEWAQQWMIVLASSSDGDSPWANATDEIAAERIFQKSFTALHAHMKALEPALRKRSDHGRFWWELRSCAYYNVFEQSKVIYSDILWQADFCVAPAGTYCNNTSYVLPIDDAWLLACLNSPAMWNYLWRTAQHGKDEALRMFTEYVVTVPIARTNERLRARVNTDVSAISDASRLFYVARSSVLDVLRVEYDIESPGNALSDFPNLDSEAFVREVKKRRPKGNPLTPVALKALRMLFETEVPPILEKRAAILKCEREIADAVHEAYGLTPEDLKLLRDTAPPRMPPGW
jgi:type I restriction-modification system DNA methylase subunit